MLALPTCYPQPMALADARRVVLAPPLHDADLRLYAWALLKSDRGQTLIQIRVIEMQRRAGLRAPAPVQIEGTAIPAGSDA